MFKLPFEPRERVMQVNEGVSLCHPEFKDECNINNIMARWQKTGVIEHVSSNRPVYDDLPDSVDYHFAMNVMLEANDAFKSLPSGLRARFENDPLKFLEFCENPSNRVELASMGLLKDNVVEQPIKLDPVSETQS